MRLHLCYATVPPMRIVLRINTNQEKLHRMRMGANISLKNPLSVLVLPQDRINTMRYDNMCELIRTEHELIGCNRMAIRCTTMQYGLHGEPVRMC